MARSPSNAPSTDAVIEPSARSARSKQPTGRGNGRGDLGFEATLWQAADKLRGNLDSAEYKHVVLGLIFLKYISDAFDEARTQVGADPEGDPEDRDEYASRNVFWVPMPARWESLQSKAKRPEVGKLLDDAMDAIEDDNPRLKGVLPKDYARPALDKRRLGELIDLIGRVGLGDAENRSKDIIGRVYEYFLGQFASAEGKKGGEFYTPRQVVRLLVEMLAPRPRSRIYDPCCGSGGMFVQSERFIEEHGGRKGDISIFGQELNWTTWRLCQMNLAIRGIEAKVEQGDTFHADKLPDLKADYVLANPPFNVSDWGGEQLREDVRWKFGVPPVGNANFAWVQHFMHHLAPHGMAGFVLANAGTTGERLGQLEIRRNLVEGDVVDCIVALPSQLFYSTPIAVSLWFIARDRSDQNFRDRRRETLFIDARRFGRMVDKTHRELSDDEISTIADAYHSWRGDRSASFEDEPGFSKSVSTSDIRREGYVLAPARYVGSATKSLDRANWNERVRTIADALEFSFAQSRSTAKDAATAITFLRGTSPVPQEKMKATTMGAIPLDWSIEALGDLADVVDCLHARKPVRATVGRILLQVWNISDDGIIDLSDPFFISEEDYALWTSRIEVRAGDSVVTNTGRVGAVAQIPPGLTAAIGRNMTAIRCKPSFPYPTYLFEALRSPLVRAEIDRMTDSGTVLESLNVRSITKLRVPRPPDETLAEYEPINRALRERVEHLLSEAAVLRQVRNDLLPSLTTGQVG